jgi:hypothetical protein
MRQCANAPSPSAAGDDVAVTRWRAVPPGAAPRLGRGDGVAGRGRRRRAVAQLQRARGVDCSVSRRVALLTRRLRPRARLGVGAAGAAAQGATAGADVRHALQSAARQPEPAAQPAAQPAAGYTAAAGAEAVGGCGRAPWAGGGAARRCGSVGPRRRSRGATARRLRLRARLRLRLRARRGLGGAGVRGAGACVGPHPCAAAALPSATGFSS